MFLLLDVAQDSGVNLVAATATGLVGSPVVELFVVAEHVALLLEISLFLLDLFLCLSLDLRRTLH